MGALVSAEQSGAQLQAGRGEVLHVAVVHHCSQEQEEEQEEEEEESHAVPVLQILGLGLPAGWVGSDGVQGKVPLWLNFDSDAGRWG